ncbi:MAG TPA: porin [Nitrospirota bacterium]|nr:porin [Nitrospirota bacterium]
MRFVFAVALSFLFLVSLCSNARADEVTRGIVEALHDKGVLDDESYRRLIEKEAAPAPQAAPAPASAERPLDGALTQFEEGFARLSGDTVKLKLSVLFQAGWLIDDADFSVTSPPTTGRTLGVDNQFFVRRARLFFDGQLSKKIGFRISTELSQSTGILYDAYVFADYIPYARITLGQLKVPFGVEGVEALGAHVLVSRSMATNFIHNPTLRDLGVMLNGKYETKLHERPLGMGYAVALLNGTGRNAQEDNDHKDVAGRVWVNPLVPGLTVGGSFLVGKASPAAGLKTDRQRWAADLDYSPPAVKGLKLRGEFLRDRKYFTAYASKNITETTGLPAFGRYAHSYGWYTLAAYKVDGLKGHWRYLNGFEPAVRYEYLDEDMATPDDARNRTTVGLNYYMNKWSRVMANYEITHADAALRVRSLETIDTITHHLFTTILQVRF